MPEKSFEYSAASRAEVSERLRMRIAENIAGNMAVMRRGTVPNDLVASVAAEDFKLALEAAGNIMESGVWEHTLKGVELDESRWVSHLGRE